MSQEFYQAGTQELPPLSPDAGMDPQGSGESVNDPADIPIRESGTKEQDLRPFDPQDPSSHGYSDPSDVV